MDNGFWLGGGYLSTFVDCQFTLGGREGQVELCSRVLGRNGDQCSLTWLLFSLGACSLF